MSLELLDKTRKLNRLLHDFTSKKVVFNDICQVLGESMDSTVLVISRKGKLLGLRNGENIRKLSGLSDLKIGEVLEDIMNERLLSVLSTKENVSLLTLGFEEAGIETLKAIIAPIHIGSERLGTLVIYKNGEPYDIDDIILGEYGTTVVGMEMMRSEREENDKESRKYKVVQSAVSTLSFTELEAIGHILDELGAGEGVIKASKVADMYHITRSVIVNAIRKLESAGVLETRSSGMKGTYIKVLNDAVFEELERMKND